METKRLARLRAPLLQGLCFAVLIIMESSMEISESIALPATLLFMIAARLIAVESYPGIADGCPSVLQSSCLILPFAACIHLMQSPDMPSALIKTAGLIFVVFASLAAEHSFASRFPLSCTDSPSILPSSHAVVHIFSLLALGTLIHFIPTAAFALCSIIILAQILKSPLRQPSRRVP